MYVLKKNPMILATAEAARAKLEWARQRLDDASRGLTFDPGAHRYYLGGRELPAVSTIVKAFDRFDAVEASRKASANPRSPYFGTPPEEILAAWEQKRDAAAAAGTALHAFGEVCCSFLLGLEDEIPPEFACRVTDGGLAAESPKEEAVARWWASHDWSRFAVVAKETRVVNPSLRYAGTFDLLLYDLHTNSFAQKDYKSNEDLRKWYGDMLRPPLNMIKANDEGKYTVQQTLYSIVLSNIGLNVGSNDLIWLKEGDYEEVPLDMQYDKVISYAVRELNKTDKT